MDDSAPHHERYALGRLDVLYRIAIDGDEVGLVARGDPPDLEAQSERFGGPAGGADQRADPPAAQGQA